MSDTHTPEQSTSEQDVNQASTQESSVSSGPGAVLKAARSALGLSQKQVAKSLHLRLSSIEAIERDELEDGVSVTFTKGYVRLYARLLNLDVQPLLDAHDNLHQKQPKATKLQSFSRRTTRETHDSRWNIVSIIVVLLLVASLVVWWIDREDYFSDNDASTANDVVAEQIPNINENEKVEGVDANAVLNDLSSTVTDIQAQNDSDIASQTDVSANQENAIIESEESFSSPDELQEVAALGASTERDDADLEQSGSENSVPSVALNSTISDTAQALIDRGYQVNEDGTVDLVFTFSDDCWVSVKDAFGEIMAIGVKAKGRVMEVSGVPPVAIILGAPQAVSINFGGTEVDMSPYPATNAANFSLPIESD